MEKFQSLADYLGVQQPADASPEPSGSVYKIPEHLDAKEFAQRFLSSPEFKRYLVNSLTLGEIPPAVITRMMDYAWGKPVERVEHSGKDGAPIVTEVRRVIIHAHLEPEPLDEPMITH